MTTKIMLNFIKGFPSARLIRVAKPRVIQKALKQPGAGRGIVSFSSEDIVKAAKSSVATVSPAKELILSGKVSTLQHLEQRRDELTEVLTEACKSMMLEELIIVTSIDGIDKGTATTFLAEMGFVKHFISSKKVIAYAGLDPSVYQSGKFKGFSKLSKRGNRHLRRVIWLMTINVIHFNQVFRNYFLKRRNEGLPFKKAVFATAHKLLRVIFAMVSQKTTFRGIVHS